MCTNQNGRRMKTTLLVVGRTVEQHYITAINDYIQRTKRFITFDMEVIPELKNTKSLSMDLQKEKEGELILKALQPGDVIVLLDEHGKEMRSLEFAEYMKRKMNTVNKRLVFIIGGPYGRGIKQNFNKIMSQQEEYISKLSLYLFWDIDITKADMDTCPAQIIQRVLEYGQWEDWQLIRSYYGLDKIVSICKSLRTLDPKALAYICCISNTSKEEYRCYHESLRNPTIWNTE